MTQRQTNHGALAAALAGMGLVSGLNAAAMLGAPETWYWSVPGVPNTGPLNVHFVRDIGVTFATLSAALGLAAVLPVHRAILTFVASLWFAGHAALHIFDITTGCLPASHWLIDLPGVFLVALIMAGLSAWAFLERRA